MNKLAVCSECSSIEIYATANVWWDVDKGRCVLEDDCDHTGFAYCHNCDGECTLEYLTPKELKVHQVKGRLLSSKGVYNIDLYKGMDAGAIYKKIQGDV